MSRRCCAGWRSRRDSRGYQRRLAEFVELIGIVVADGLPEPRVAAADAGKDGEQLARRQTKIESADVEARRLLAGGGRQGGEATVDAANEHTRAAREVAVVEGEAENAARTVELEVDRGQQPGLPDRDCLGFYKVWSDARQHERSAPRRRQRRLVGDDRRRGRQG